MTHSLNRKVQVVINVTLPTQRFFLETHLKNRKHHGVVLQIERLKLLDLDLVICTVVTSSSFFTPLDDLDTCRGQSPRYHGAHDSKLIVNALIADPGEGVTPAVPQAIILHVRFAHKFRTLAIYEPSERKEQEL